MPRRAPRSAPARRQPKRPVRDRDLDTLAYTASRVLSRYGEPNSDWDEWRDLKNALLKILPRLSEDFATDVGRRCSSYLETFHRENPDL